MRPEAAKQETEVLCQSTHISQFDSGLPGYAAATRVDFASEGGSWRRRAAMLSHAPVSGAPFATGVAVSLLAGRGQLEHQLARDRQETLALQSASPALGRQHRLGRLADLLQGRNEPAFRRLPASSLAAVAGHLPGSAYRAVCLGCFLGVVAVQAAAGEAFLLGGPVRGDGSGGVECDQPRGRPGRAGGPAVRGNGRTGDVHAGPRRGARDVRLRRDDGVWLDRLRIGADTPVPLPHVDLHRRSGRSDCPGFERRLHVSGKLAGLDRNIPGAGG